jgi:hypothetical protein
MSEIGIPTGSQPERRRSTRVLGRIPVRILARGKFAENTETLVVNAHGALITLVREVAMGRIVRMTNLRFRREQENCRVVYLGPKMNGRTEVGLEFIESTPDFWHIPFPSGDWIAPTMEEVASQVRRMKYLR